jgi:hypothetical protein
MELACFLLTWTGVVSPEFLSFCVLDLRFVLTWTVVGGSAALGSCSLGEAKQVAREGVKQREEPDIPMFV